MTVKMVEDHELPEGHEWALVRQQKAESDPPCRWLFVKRSARPTVMADIAAALTKLQLRGD